MASAMLPISEQPPLSAGETTFPSFFLVKMVNSHFQVIHKASDAPQISAATDSNRPQDINRGTPLPTGGSPAGGRFFSDQDRCGYLYKGMRLYDNY